MAKSVEQKRAIIQSMITLAGAALGLVCALAWNDPIKSTMRSLLGGTISSPVFTHVRCPCDIDSHFVLIWLAKAAAKVGGEAAVSREAEG